MKNILVPKYCINCLHPEQYLCNTCFKKLSYVLPTCPICNRLSNDYKVHKACSSISSINKIVALYEKNNIAKKMLHEIRNKNRHKILDYLINSSKEKILHIFNRYFSSQSLLIPYSTKDYWDAKNAAQTISLITGIKLLSSDTKVYRNTNLIIIDTVITKKSRLSLFAKELQEQGFKDISVFSLFGNKPYKFKNDLSKT